MVRERLDEFLFRRVDRFGLLVALLVSSYLITGIDRSDGVRLVAGLLTAAALIVGFASTGMPGGLLGLSVFFLTALVGSVMVSTMPVDGLGMAIGAFGQGLCAGVLTVVVLVRVSRHERVTGQTILGAIAGYLLIGQVFAWLYLSLPGFIGEPVLEPASTGEVPLYFSYVVLTTLGFGDIKPVGSFPQRLVTLEALAGQIFLAVLVARLVAVYSQNHLGRSVEDVS